MERSPRRHYLGRLIGTYIVLRTGLAVYDTQCGTKFFRVSKELRMALATPFGTRWLFDVELLRRLTSAHQETGRPLRMREEPLETWADVGESRLRGSELLRVARDFARLETELRVITSADQVFDIAAPTLGRPENDYGVPGRATA